MPGRMSYDEVEKASLAANHPWREGKERKLDLQRMYPLTKNNNNTALTQVSLVCFFPQVKLLFIIFCIVNMSCMVLLLCLLYILHVLACSYLVHFVSVVKFIIILSQPTALTLRFVVFLFHFYVIKVSNLGQ